MNAEGQEKLLQLSQRLVKLNDLRQEDPAPIHGVMAEEFDDAANQPYAKRSRERMRGACIELMQNPPRVQKFP